MSEPWKKKFVFLLQLSALFVFVSTAEVESRLYDPAGFLERAHAFSNLTVYLSFLDDVFYHLGNNDWVSPNCSSDTQTLLNEANNGDAAALKILDSSGKPSSGILVGGIYFIGYYSECVNTAVKVNTNSINGQYCLVNFFNFSIEVQPKEVPQASWLVLSHAKKPPTIGICIPSSCSTADLQNATTLSLQNNFVESNVQVCHGKPRSFMKDTGAVYTLCVFIIFATIAVIATFVDTIQEHKGSINISNGNFENSKSISREILCKLEESESPKRSTSLECLLAFSLKKNAKKIFNVGGGDENIRCVHGLKFLSMALIILGHTFSFATQNMFFRNPGAANQAPKDFLSQIFANGTLAVDTFYLISGLLVAFVTLKVLDKTKGKFPICYFYFHRYFRLTPLMMAVVIFCAYLLRYLGAGPNWLNTIKMYDEWCKTNGWLNLLYLHNFINTETMCLSHTWYLATDMQIYLVVPLMLYPMYRNFKIGAAVLFTFLLNSIITTAIITVKNHYPAIPYINDAVPIDIVNAYYKNVYIKPYCRIGPYIIGIAVGYFLLNNKELVLKKATVALLWFSSIALGLTVIYLMWPANQGILPTDSEAAAYSALARTVWAVTLSWLVIACFYGYGGIINKMLSWSVLVPFSRLTYCAYLIHPVVMNVYYGSTETVVDFSMSLMMYLFLGNICITFVISIILSLVFESPFVALEKVILSKKSS